MQHVDATRISRQQAQPGLCEPVGNAAAARQATAQPALPLPPLSCFQGGYKYHQYQVAGRHLPSEKEEEPSIYRMKLWATDPARAKSKFW